MAAIAACGLRLVIYAILVTGQALLTCRSRSGGVHLMAPAAACEMLRRFVQARELCLHVASGAFGHRFFWRRTMWLMAALTRSMLLAQMCRLLAVTPCALGRVGVAGVRVMAVGAGCMSCVRFSRLFAMATRAARRSGNAAVGKGAVTAYA